MEEKSSKSLKKSRESFLELTNFVKTNQENQKDIDLGIRFKNATMSNQIKLINPAEFYNGKFSEVELKKTFKKENNSEKKVVFFNLKVLDETAEKVGKERRNSILPAHKDSRNKKGSIQKKMSSTSEGFLKGVCLKI